MTQAGPFYKSAQMEARATMETHRMSGPAGDVAPMDRRLDFADLLGPGLDSRNEACHRRIFLFATQRTASWTACRYLTAAGWGVACEYFGGEIVSLSRRLLGHAAAASLRHDELGRYRFALEDSRSRNGIFSTKVFWHEFGRVSRAYPDEVLNAASHIFLRRRDFPAQVVSMAVGLQNLRFSFSDQAFDIGGADLPKAGEDAVLKRCAEFLLRSERSWFELFSRRGWRPLLIDSEALLEDPLPIFERLSRRLGLAADEAGLHRCHQFERNGRYETDSLTKQRLASDHAVLLAGYARRRAEQFEGYATTLLQTG